VPTKALPIINISFVSMGKNQIKKMMFLGSIIKANKVCITTQVDYQVVTFELSSTPCFNKININSFVLFPLL
jgi:hypothetical protein